MALDLFRAIQQISRASTTTDVQNALASAGLGGTSVEAPSEAPDGEGGKLITTAIVNRSDPFIPLGSWKLRLLGRGASGQVRVPIALKLEPGGTFRELRVEVGRIELEADPKHLQPAGLISEPHIRLQPAGGTVKLHGPGAAVVFTNPQLDFRLEPLSAGGAATPTDMPSLRFEPPHFIAPAGGIVGFACGDAMWDYSSTESPAGFPPEDQGLFLKDLGIFFTDTGPGSWWGSANLRDFYMRFDPVEISGTFEGEIGHNVVNEPQATIHVSFEDGDGRLHELDDTTDPASVPAPGGGAEVRRVHLRAVLEWDSASAHGAWTLPDGVTAEEPGRLAQELVLGWVQMPPGTHTVKVDVEDIGLSTPLKVERPVQVGLPSQPSQSELDVVFEARILDDPDFPPPQQPSNRLHVAIAPNRRLQLSATVGGGTASSLQLTLAPSSSFTADGPLSQTVSKPQGSNVFGKATWMLRPSTDHGEGAVVLSVADSAGASVLAERRLRYLIEPSPAAGSRDFDLVSYTDWRAEPGIGLALVRLRNGAAFEDLEWELGSVEMPDDLFANQAHDALFNGSAPAGEQIELVNSSGTVRPWLGEPDRLWCLTGRLPASASGPPPMVVVGAGAGASILRRQSVSDLLTRPADYVAAGEPVRFHYNLALLQPTAAQVPRNGPEDPAETAAESNAAQLRGIVALYRALYERRGSLQALTLVGGASVEGTGSHNLTLSQERAEAVRKLLREEVAMPATVRTALAEAGIDDSAIGEVRSAVSAPGFDIQALAVGESAAATTVTPADRMVIAIIDPRSVAQVGEVVRREYFLTYPQGARPPDGTPPVPQRKTQRPPFQHEWFRSARALVEMRRNHLTRLQVRLEIDTSAAPVPEEGRQTYLLDWRELP
jgi:hypothetical protein